jgi:cell division protein ZapB
MEADLKVLEEKISQLIEMCEAMRQSNASLKQALEVSAQHERELKEKIEKATLRLESLLDKLPEDNHD